jgi:hypothetical protein
MQAVPLQFSAERANENPLEKWSRILVTEANSAARKAVSKGYASLSRVGQAAYNSFQGTGSASDVRLFSWMSLLPSSLN